MGDFRQHMLSLVVSKILAKNADESCFPAYLAIIKENSLLQQKESVIHDVISHINSCLNSSNKRQEGLSLLNELVDQCEDDVFHNQALTWCKLLTATLESYDAHHVLEECCEVMMKLLQKITNFPEIKHDATSSIIPQLLWILIQAKPEWQISAIKCLTVCLKYFHGPCVAVQNKIEFFIMQNTTDCSAETLEVIGECYSLMAQAGGGGHLQVQHTEMWINHMSKVTETLKALLVDLYFADPTLELPVVQQVDKLDLGDIPDEEPRRTLALQSYFKTAAIIADCMLRTEFGAPVKIPVEDILDLLCVSLSVSPKQLMRNSNFEKTILSCVLPSIHKSAFTILSSLIDVCGSNLLLYTNIINKLFIQVLNYSWSPAETVNHHVYKELRLQIYSTLLTWLERMGALSNINKISSKLLSHFTHDLKPHQNVVKMSAAQPIDLDAFAGKLTKKKRQAMMTDFGKLNVQQDEDLQTEYEVTRSALKVLKLILTKSGSLVSHEFHLATRDLVVGALLTIQTSRHFPTPYNDSKCRKNLYKVLMWLVLHPHPHGVPPTHCAVGIFRRGQLDSAYQVKSACAKALAACEVVIHPRAPSIMSPVSIASADTSLGVLGGGKFAYQDLYQRIELKETNNEQPNSPEGDKNGKNAEKTESGHDSSEMEEEGDISSIKIGSESQTDSVEEVIDISDQDPEMSVQIVEEEDAVLIDSASDDELKASEHLQAKYIENTTKRQNAGDAGDTGDTIPNGHSPGTEKTDEVAKGGKRKLSVESKEDEPASKMKVKDDSKTEEGKTEEVEDMLSTFVDAGPDTD